MKIWETPLSCHMKCCLPVAVRVSKTRVLKLIIIINWPFHGLGSNIMNKALGVPPIPVPQNSPRRSNVPSRSRSSWSRENKTRFSVFLCNFLIRFVVIRELKHATFLSTRTATGSDFAKKLTSHVTDVKSQTSKLAIWRLW